MNKRTAYDVEDLSAIRRGIMRYKYASRVRKRRKGALDERENKQRATKAVATDRERRLT